MTQSITQERIARFEEFVAKHAQAGTLEVALMEALKSATNARSEAQRLRDELAWRDAVRVEVPELTYEAFAEIMDSTESLLGIRQRETVRRERITAWFRARLVPAPPQADAVVVPREEWERLQKFERDTKEADSRDCSDCAHYRRSQSCPGCRHPEGPQNEYAFDWSVAQRCHLYAIRTSAQDHNDNETRG